VTLLQDENGNILSYKPQFMNALKLAVHAIIHEAYINVNEEKTDYEWNNGRSEEAIQMVEATTEWDGGGIFEELFQDI